MKILISLIFKKAISLAFIFSACFFSEFLVAQDNEYPELYNDFGLTPDHGSTVVDGEFINRLSNTYYWESRDIYLPGDGGLDIEVYRSYAKTDNLNLALETWELEVPRVRLSASATGRTIGERDGTGLCEDPLAETISGKSRPRTSGATIRFSGKVYYSGLELVIPGHAPKRLLFKLDSATQYPSDVKYVTTDHWIVRCISTISPNSEKNAFQVTSPQGIVYTLDKVARFVGSSSRQPSKIEVYATEKKDPYGNWIRYTYDDYISQPTEWRSHWVFSGDLLPRPFTIPYLKRMESYDGRVVSFGYEDTPFGKRLSTSSVNGRVWRYQYKAGGQFTQRGHARNFTPSLSKVILPDRSTWELDHEMIVSEWGSDFFGNYADVQRRIEHSLYAPLLKKVTTPEKLSVEYEYPYCPDSEIVINSGDPGGFAPCALVTYGRRGRGGVSPLIKRIVTDPVEGRYVWEISARPDKLVAPDSRLVGDKNNRTFRYYKTPTELTVYEYYLMKLFDGESSDYWKHSLLLSKKVYEPDADPNTARPLSVVNYTWGKQEEIGEDFIHIRTVGGNQFNRLADKSQRMPKILLSTSLVINGDEYQTHYANHGVYGNPRTIIERGNANKTKTISYQNFTDIWKIGLADITHIGGTQVSDLDYTSLGLLEKENILGLEKNYQYYDNGNLRRIEYNTPLIDRSGNRYEEFHNYKLGIAQTRLVPDRVNSGHPISMFKTVDDNGWVTSETDFNGVIKRYVHDQMGRLIAIGFQGDGNELWLDHLIEWDFTSSSAPTKTITRCRLNFLNNDCISGSSHYRTTESYNGLLLPTQVKHEDLLARENTRYQRFTYDHLGRKTFNSYWSHKANEDEGNVYTYDSLGRLISLMETVVGAPSTYSYLPDYKVLFTDPKGNRTTTTYLTYGEPTLNLPTKYESPENVVTDITYNLFDNMISVSQGGFTADYVYDSQQRLCKLFRPEAGWHYFDYNTNDEMVWSASGISSSAPTCDRNTVPENKKIYFSYDNRGDLRQTTYPDSTPDISRTYDNNGNLLTLYREDGTNWRYGYNNLNLLEWEQLSIDGLTFHTGYGYNRMGQADKITYPSGRVVNSSVNAFGEVTHVGHYVSDVNYHSSGAIESFRYSNKITHTVSYNARQLPEDFRLLSGVGWTLVDLHSAWDDNANISQIRDDIDSIYTINLDYDGLNRLIEADGKWGVGRVEYDAVGNIRSKQLGSRVLNYHYDSSNRLDRVTGSLGRNFDYDARGNVTHNGRRSFSYNSNNEMVNSSGMTFRYDGHQRRVNNSAGDYFVYSQQGQLLHKRKASGDTVDYIYLDGNLIARSETETLPERTMLERNRDRFRIQNYWQRDWYINIEDSEVAASDILSGWYSAMWYFDMTRWWNDYFRIQNRWKQDEYLHIEHGALESGLINEHWYSAQWGLTPINVAEPELDGKVFQIFNRWKPDHYLNIDNGTLVASPSLMNWQSSHWILHNLDINNHVDEKVIFTHFDHLGSTIGESNEQGRLTRRYRYEPFGKSTGYNDNKNEPGYTGHVFDQNLGLNYMLARYYDPEIGRFYSNDPVGYTTTNPVMSFNRYLYANNNPYKYTDPNGEFAFLIPVIIFIAKEIVAEVASQMTGGATDFLSIRRMGTKIGKFVTKGGSAGAMKRLEFEASPKHGKSARSTSKGVASRGPTDGQHALDNSVQVKGTSPRRVGVDKANGEITVFDQTSNGIFHGHVRSFKDLTSQQQNALRNAGLVDKKGNF